MTTPPDHFSAVANDYANFRPDYPPALFDWLKAQCPNGKTVWDVGCGSGQASVALAERFASVHATDISAEQIANAPPRANIHYRVAPAEHSGFADASIDLVTVAQALHWFDVPRFHEEVKRVLKPGGLLAEWTYSPIRLENAALNAILQRFYIEVATPWWPPGREHVENGYSQLPFPFPRLPDPGFAIQREMTLPQLIGYVRSWSAMSRYISANKTDPTLQLATELAQAMGSEEKIAVSWLLKLRTGYR
ncbi:MAG: class I SAM-dependent methyltransferase [Pseudomonadota bacterium]